MTLWMVLGAVWVVATVYALASWRGERRRRKRRRMVLLYGERREEG